MEKRIGSALIVVSGNSNIELLNKVISRHSGVILGRMGLPARERDISIISLILEGTTDDIGALTGQLGRIDGVIVKSLLIKARENDHEES